MSPLDELNRQALALIDNGLARRDAYRLIIDEAERHLSRRSDALGEDPFPLKHQFADGAYLRQIFIPADSIIVGKIHRTRHISFMTVGEVSVLTQEGVVRIKAPWVGICPAGTKRCVYAHSDTLWFNVHATNETDIGKIEAQVIAKTYAELEAA